MNNRSTTIAELLLTCDTTVDCKNATYIAVLLKQVWQLWWHSHRDQDHNESGENCRNAQQPAPVGDEVGSQRQTQDAAGEADGAHQADPAAQPGTHQLRGQREGGETPRLQEPCQEAEEGGSRSQLEHEERV